MSERRIFSPGTISVLSAKAATGVGNAVNVADYRNILVQVSAPLNTSLTIKFQGSVSASVPDFSAARTTANHWDYVESYDQQNTTAGAITGDTGVTLDNDTAANNTRIYMINTEFMRWFNTEVTAYTDGSVTVNVFGVSF